MRLTTASLHDVVDLSAADNSSYLSLHACAMHAAGTVSCWGNGSYGQLGQGSSASHCVPVVVPRITDAVAVATGTESTCALHAGC